MVTPQRKKKPAIRHTRLRFGRQPNGAAPQLPPYYWQRWEDMDLSQYDEDLIELKRRAEADGIHVQIPRRDAVWREPTPLHIEGEQLSDVIIRLRHGDS